MTILILAGLSDKKLASKLLPLQEVNTLSEIILFRRKHIDFPHVTCYSPPAWAWIPLWIKECHRIGMVIRYLMKHKVDYIVGFQFWPHLVLGNFFSKIFKTKYIAIFTGHPMRRSRSLYYKPMIRQAHRIGVRGTKSKDFLVAQGVNPDHIFILPNYHVFHDHHPGPTSKKYDLIFGGNLIPVKQPDFFLKIVKELKSDFPDIRVAISGDGYLFSRLIRMAKRYGLKDHVDFLGNVQDMVKILKRSKVLIMTSISEGLPMIMVEAMELGIPSIVPKVGDITDVALDYVNARVLDVHDLNAYTSACKELLTNETLYHAMSAEAKKITQTKAKEYSLQHIASIWKAIFK